MHGVRLVARPAAKSSGTASERLVAQGGVEAIGEQQRGHASAESAACATTSGAVG